MQPAINWATFFYLGCIWSSCNSSQLQNMVWTKFNNQQIEQTKSESVFLQTMLFSNMFLSKQLKPYCTLSTDGHMVMLSGMLRTWNPYNNYIHSKAPTHRTAIASLWSIKFFTLKLQHLCDRPSNLYYGHFTYSQQRIPWKVILEPLRGHVTYVILTSG